MITTYKSSKGQIWDIVKMPSNYLQNAINKLKLSMNLYKGEGRKEKEKLLVALQKEYNDRENGVNGKEHF